MKAKCCRLLIISLGLLLLVGGVHAGDRLKAEPATAPPTGTVIVSGEAFTPNGLVEVFLKWKRCSLSADATGRFTCRFRVPKMLEPSATTIWAVDRTTRRWSRTPFVVRTDWSNEAFDAGRSRYNPYENVLNASNVSELKPLWTRPGRVRLVADGHVLVDSATPSGLMALNESDGREVWQHPADRIWGITYANSRVYVATGMGSNPVGEWLYISEDMSSLTSENGETNWTRTISPPSPLPGNVELASTNVRPDLIFFTTSHDWQVSANQLFTPDPYAFGAYRVDDGSHERFIRRDAHFDLCTGRITPPILSEHLLFSSFIVGCYPGYSYLNNNIYDISNPWTDVRADMHRCEMEEMQQVCLIYMIFTNAGSGVFTQTGHHYPRGPTLVVSSIADGVPLWSWRAPPDAKLGVPAVTPAAIYVGVDRAQGSRLYAFDTRRGTLLWSRAVAAKASIQATVANGVIYLGRNAYDARNGKLLWTNPNVVDTVSPIVVNGRLYANQIDGTVSAWGLQ